MPDTCQTPLVDLNLELCKDLPPVMGFGPFLKATVTSIEGGMASMSRNVGDLGTPEAIQDFEVVVEGMKALMGEEPKVIAHDLHPDFYSTRYAEMTGLPTLPVQHHHAHTAAVVAEHGVEGPVIGLSLDGFGLGPDNQSWGGELLVCDGADFKRIGHLGLLAQPGGDVAAREPWRMGAAVLHKLGRGSEISGYFADQKHSQMLPQMLDKGLNAPMTSSAGRLFDAACGLLNVIPVATFEGEAPMKLESMVTAPEILDGGWTLSDKGVLDLMNVMERLVGMNSLDGANLFHGTLIAALADWAVWAKEKTGIETIALSGGCFFNQVLKSGLLPLLEESGLAVLAPMKVSPGDPAISLGQAWVAAHSDLV